MSTWLGQQLSERGGPGTTDPLRTRLWLAGQYILTLVSGGTAFGLVDDWGARSLLFGGAIFATGTGLLYLTVPGPRKDGVLLISVVVSGVLWISFIAAH